MVVEIDSADDARLADYRTVSEPALARREAVFVAEGRAVVRRVIDDGRYHVRSVLVSHQAYSDLAPALGQLSDEVPVYVCHVADFLGITGFNLHRGCLALVARPPDPLLGDLLKADGPLVLLDGVANPDNIGGVFRNAAAFGIGAVLLSPACGDPLYRKAVRTSMGAVLSVPFLTLRAWPEELEQIRDAGFAIVALTPREPSERLEAFCAQARPSRLAIAIGAEGGGVSPVVEALAEYRVRIPTTARVDSLNLAVAAGIALYRLAGQ